MATARAARNETVRPLPEGDREPRRHLRLVRPGSRRLGIRLTPRVGVSLTILLFVALFGVAVSHALLIERQSHLDRLDEEVADEQARYEELRLDVAELESPERILADAAELGMVPPSETVWLTPDQAAAGDGSAETTDGAEGASQGAGEGEGEGDDSDMTWDEVKPHLGSAP
jgi:cell division protein FtsL